MQQLRLRNGLRVKYINRLSSYHGNEGVIESSRQPLESSPTVIDYLIRFPSGNGTYAFGGNLAVLPGQDNPTVIE